MPRASGIETPNPLTGHKLSCSELVGQGYGICHSAVASLVQQGLGSNAPESQWEVSKLF